MRERSRTTWYLVAAVVVLGAVGLFLVDVGSTSPDPVDFDDTISMGLAFDDEVALEDDVELPRVQVFYSQYQYVTGYYGVERFVEVQREPTHEQRFGYPLAIYVTDYAESDLELTDDGYPNPAAEPGWVDAADAVYVVGSDARTPSSETVVPFGDRAAAEAFVDDHGGSVLTWEAVLETEFDLDDAGTVRERVDDHHANADALVDDSRALLERPETVVVGEDADTIQGAIDAAGANETVVVPDGTYEETVTIDRPITLRGEGDVTIDGGGNGSVVALESPRAAVVGLELTGVGEETGDELAVDHQPDEDADLEAWEDDLEGAYSEGDAGVVTTGAAGALIEDVTIETPANGVLLRHSPDAVVRNVTVYGAENWRDGYMGVVAMHSPGVIEDSTFIDGRDGVYTHRADGIVIRGNHMEGGRMGVHFMYTSDALIANNHASDQDNVGIYVMTGPERIGIVENEVVGNPRGIRPEGSDSYVARNVIVGNQVGLRAEASNTIYEENVIAGNVQGMQARSMLPTNLVVGNDFVDNVDHASSGPFTPLRVWTQDERGNYWDGSIGETDGVVLERSFSPTHPVDQRLPDVDGTPTLARAPVIDAVSSFEATVPGMRAGDIVDTAPLCEPTNADWFDAVEWELEERHCDPESENS
ncbi:NosD domain-containing protein [Natronobeatus ordinarius]|uniref:NosD domain-containing protein n=1 Tax=Natronobeatus ordinarius TaxID=2963433 RepID=UPI0020CC5092|nr:NosD domain-containing protein [Natronobeatus ordinarius]